MCGARLHSRHLKHAAACWSLAFMVASTAIAQPADKSVRRLRGIIDQDQTWSGHIIITDHLAILDATVTVTPGTVIEFAHAGADQYPVLTVGSELHERGSLQMQSTAEKPIIIRSRPQTHPGHIVVYIRNRFVPLTLTNRTTQQTSVEVTWNYIHVENLGSRRISRQPRRDKTGYYQPALSFHLVGPSHKLRITDCQFNHTSQLQIISDDDSQITLNNNRFDRPVGRIAVEIDGSRIKTRSGLITVTGNQMSTGLLLDSVSAVIQDNRLIGPQASLIIREDDSSKTRIVNNYIHNTADRDDGRYCLNCENPNAVIEKNILRGGTTCVLNGSRSMSGNVFIAAANLSSQYVKQSRTHQLVAALPGGAVFERNLLLGPAYSLMIPQPFQTHTSQTQAAGATVIIRNNVFDGLAKTNRAIHMNPPGRSPVKLAVENNLFLRLPTLIYDEGRTKTTVTYADHNAAAPPPRRPFDQVTIDSIQHGNPGWAGRDVIRESIIDLLLNGEPPQRLPDDDEIIRSAALKAAQLRRRLFDIYRPRPESPLVGAGRNSTGNQSTPNPSIGTSEPIKPSP